jgi:hypothetical protein
VREKLPDKSPAGAPVHSVEQPPQLNLKPKQSKQRLLPLTGRDTFSCIYKASAHFCRHHVGVRLLVRVPIAKMLRDLRHDGPCQPRAKPQPRKTLDVYSEIGLYTQSERSQIHQNMGFADFACWLT